MTSYDGRVPGRGTAISRELSQLTVTKMSVGSMDNNAYLLVDRLTGDAVLIDAADDGADLIALIAGAPGTPVVHGIVTTHRHTDHWRALARVVTATGARTYAGAADAAAIAVPTDVTVRDRDTITFGASALRVIGLRGHTPGSVALLYLDPTGSAHLFTGDSLFPGGVGHTGSPADFGQLLDDVTVRVFAELPDDTWVYPGHGADTTLGAERPHLAEWRARGW